MRLLIVEDDLDLASAVRAGLQRRGLLSDHAASAGDAEWMMRDVSYAAIVLDLGLPDGDGMGMLRRLRTRSDGAPVLILSARGDVSDRLMGLDAGADDYLVKPFDMDELAARLRALLRRGNLRGRSLALGNVGYDTSTRELTVDGEVVGLSSRESELIGLMLQRAGRVVTKRFAEDQLFGMEDSPGSNAVEVYIHRLRRKLEQAGASIHIHTVRGVGYFLQNRE